MQIIIQNKMTPFHGPQCTCIQFHTAAALRRKYRTTTGVVACYWSSTEVHSRILQQIITTRRKLMIS